MRDLRQHMSRVPLENCFSDAAMRRLRAALGHLLVTYILTYVL